MYLHKPQWAKGDGFDVFIHDREHIGYRDAQNHLLVGAELTAGMVYLYADDIIDAATRQPATPVGISLAEWRDRVVTGISLMGTNCGWSR